jgi:hypothetical protein
MIVERRTETRIEAIMHVANIIVETPFELVLIYSPPRRSNLSNLDF